MTRSLLPFLGASVLAFVSCSRSEPAKTVVGNAQVQGHYDPKTGKLQSITYDSNKNGKIDTWSYTDGARILRIEIDSNEDGKIDRWEYYTPDQRLEKVGWSRADNGKADAWRYDGADGKIAKVELAGLSPTAGTGAQPPIVRTEFYENAVLARVEEDTNGDGKTDKWETWRDGSVASVAFDTTGRGTPDRRLTYGAGGSVRIEVDSAGTGEFRPARGRQAPEP